MKELLHRLKGIGRAVAEVPVSVCRLDEDILSRSGNHKHIAGLMGMFATMILVCSGIYGLVMGSWRGDGQGLFSALKLPVMMFAVTLTSAFVNGMLAKVMGSGMSFRQTMTGILLGFAVTSVLLASLSPVMFFLARSLPCAGDFGSTHIYGRLLAAHTCVIGLCGVLGNLRLYRFVSRLSNSLAAARRTIVSWVLVSGFIGCQLSWLLSPFLARPDVRVVFWNPNAFKTNFFEYLWKFNF